MLAHLNQVSAIKSKTEKKSKLENDKIKKHLEFYLNNSLLSLLKVTFNDVISLFQKNNKKSDDEINNIKNEIKQKIVNALISIRDENKLNMDVEKTASIFYAEFEFLINELNKQASEKRRHFDHRDRDAVKRNLTMGLQILLLFMNLFLYPPINKLIRAEIEDENNSPPDNNMVISLTILLLFSKIIYDLSLNHKKKNFLTKWEFDFDKSIKNLNEKIEKSNFVNPMKKDKKTQKNWQHSDRDYIKTEMVDDKNDEKPIPPKKRPLAGVSSVIAHSQGSLKDEKEKKEKRQGKMKKDRKRLTAEEEVRSSPAELDNISPKTSTTGLAKPDNTAAKPSTALDKKPSITTAKPRTTAPAKRTTAPAKPDTTTAPAKPDTTTAPANAKPDTAPANAKPDTAPVNTKPDTAPANAANVKPNTTPANAANVKPNTTPAKTDIVKEDIFDISAAAPIPTTKNIPATEIHETIISTTKNIPAIEIPETIIFTTKNIPVTEIPETIISTTKNIPAIEIPETTIPVQNNIFVKTDLQNQKLNFLNHFIPDETDDVVAEDIPDGTDKAVKRDKDNKDKFCLFSLNKLANDYHSSIIFKGSFVLKWHLLSIDDDYLANQIKMNDIDATMECVNIHDAELHKRLMQYGFKKGRSEGSYINWSKELKNGLTFELTLKSPNKSYNNDFIPLTRGKAILDFSNGEKLPMLQVVRNEDYQSFDDACRQHSFELDLPREGVTSYLYRSWKLKDKLKRYRKHNGDPIFKITNETVAFNALKSHYRKTLSVFPPTEANKTTYKELRDFVTHKNVSDNPDVTNFINMGFEAIFGFMGYSYESYNINNKFIKFFWDCKNFLLHDNKDLFIAQINIMVSRYVKNHDLEDIKNEIVNLRCHPQSPYNVPPPPIYPMYNSPQIQRLMPNTPSRRLDASQERQQKLLGASKELNREFLDAAQEHEQKNLEHERKGLKAKQKYEKKILDATQTYEGQKLSQTSEAISLKYNSGKVYTAGNKFIQFPMPQEKVEISEKPQVPENTPSPLPAVTSLPTTANND